MIDSTLAISSAAAQPCTRRATTRTEAVSARPQTAELSVNSASPVQNTRRRP